MQIVCNICNNYYLCLVIDTRASLLTICDIEKPFYHIVFSVAYAMLDTCFMVGNFYM